MSQSEVRYTKDHEWARLEGNAVVIGISDYAQQQLGDITFVELPRVGAQLKQGGELGVVESVKAVSDVYAPVSGVVEEVNTDLESAPETVNSDPLGKGWFCRIGGVDAAEFGNLLTEEQYAQLRKEA